MSFDTLLFDTYPGRIINSIHSYSYKTSSGIETISISGLHGARYFTDLYDSVDDEFKILYNNKLNLDKQWGKFYVIKFRIADAVLLCDLKGELNKNSDIVSYA